MSEKQTIAVPKKYKERATAAFRVAGDSLEPIYFDGDHLLVEPVRPRHGEIAVFEVGGQLRVMRLYSQAGRRRLIPLNTAYQKVEATSAIRCYGRVIGRV